MVVLERLLSPSVIPAKLLRPSRRYVAAAVVAGLLFIAGLTWWQVDRPHSIANAPGAVAVLPFDNLSADPEDAFLARGFAEPTLSRLASVTPLTVIAWDSVLKLGDSATADRARKELAAGYIVNGSVQRNGTALQVNARLLDLRSGKQLLAQQYDRSLDQLYLVDMDIDAAMQGQLCRCGTYPRIPKAIHQAARAGVKESEV